MSYQGTMNIIEMITEDHDIEIQTWCDERRPLIQRPANVLLCICAVPYSVAVAVRAITFT